MVLFIHSFHYHHRPIISLAACHFYLHYYKSFMASMSSSNLTNFSVYTRYIAMRCTMHVTRQVMRSYLPTLAELHWLPVNQRSTFKLCVVPRRCSLPPWLILTRVGRSVGLSSREGGREGGVQHNISDVEYIVVNVSRLDCSVMSTGAVLFASDSIMTNYDA